MNGRLTPPPIVALVVAICVGMSTAYWIAGGREFDVLVGKLFASAKEAPRPRLPPSPPRRRQPDPERDAALREQRAAALALRGATATVVEAREAAAAWGREVEPLLKNYDGHLVAASPDLLERFRVIYRSSPAASVVPGLEGRLAAYRTTSDLRFHQGGVRAVQDDALGVRGRYRRGLSDVNDIVVLARTRGAWSPVELSMAMWSLESGYGVKPGGTSLPPGSYYIELPPWHPARRQFAPPPPPVYRPPYFARPVYPPPYPPRWHNP